MKFIVILGRILFSMLFIMSAMGHFSQSAVAYATTLGVPSPSLLVPLFGIISLLGGLSILVGYRARLGAWLLVIFLIPVTFVMHKFWMMTDPTAVNLHEAMFLKNLSLIGAALLITYFGSGPLSVDQPTKKR